MPFNRANFHKSTFCIFKESETPDRSPDYTSSSGSQYWFSDEGVFRKSNHWGRAAKCKWRLVASTGKTSRQKSGYADWSGFASDNEHEKLYFLKSDANSLHYFHKDVSDYTGEFLRTSGDTMKRIRQIRNYLKKGAVSESVLHLLLNSDKSLYEIERVISQT
ncbi:hypothetical protein HUK80_03135 [Flavobacterium sp. MAH-1]|uniref:Uncharacterized protein n=1 Tax=Flavobacterium agri TaxID=2743471 RepID=A0A7Y9C477_9FLAO|nr:hypothetical protein [Flavobacterium agri]NUY79876.1 hypothetical protein [Flavobacterium agri]NYA69901.1 hypothetical protein [Flavobacterium agri]